MKLYHGTSETIARRALEEGILPKSLSGSSGNWDHTVPSGEDRVYLTKGYAPYFASCAASEIGEDEKWGIVEVESTLVANGLYRGGRGLLPDEDFLEQMMRQYSREDIEDERLLELLDGFPWDGDMVERTGWLRDAADRFTYLTTSSLEHLGSCSYPGPIGPQAIMRVAIYDPRSNPHMTMAALDPTISCMNWSVCKNKYMETTRWFMGYDDISPNRIISLTGLIENDPVPMDPEQFRKLEALMLRIESTVAACKSGEISSKEEISRHIFEGNERPVDYDDPSPLFDQLKAGLGTKDVGEIAKVLEDYFNQTKFLLQEGQRRSAWLDEIIPNRSGITILQPKQYGTGDISPGLTDDMGYLVDKISLSLIPVVAESLHAELLKLNAAPSVQEWTAIRRSLEDESDMTTAVETLAQLIARLDQAQGGDYNPADHQRAAASMVASFAIKHAKIWTEGVSEAKQRYN